MNKKIKNKQTAVEFLLDEVIGRAFLIENGYCTTEEIQQVLELEEAQHEETFEAGYRDLHGSFEEYYIKTYKTPIQ